MFLSSSRFKLYFTEMTAGKGLSTVMSRLAAKASLFKKSVKKAEGHLRRLGDECDKER